MIMQNRSTVHGHLGPLGLEREHAGALRLVLISTAVEVQPREPIFEKCPHLGGKGGVLMLKTPRWVCAYPYSTYVGTITLRVYCSLDKIR